MIAYISMEDYVNDINQAAATIQQSIGHTFIGSVEPQSFIEVMKEVSMLTLDVLIIDLSVCEEDAALFEGIEYFRLSKNGRVVIIAPNRIAGDSLLGKLFNIGIYDFITIDTNEEQHNLSFYLESLLSKPYQYANGIKFKVENPAAEPKKRKINQKPVVERELLVEERIVYRDRVVGSVVIAIGGVERRTGTTTSAIEMAQYIAGLGYETAYIEYVKNPETSTFEFLNKLEAKHLSIYRAYTLEELIQYQGKDHKYFVVDLGALMADSELTEQYYEFVRADVRVITMGAADWDFHRHLRLIEKLVKQNYNKPTQVIVNNASKEAFRTIKGFFVKNEIPIKLSYHHNEGETKMLDNHYQGILSESLLLEKKKGKLYNLFFKQ